MNLDTSFICYLMSVITLNVFVLRKHRLNFKICHYFNLFLSTSGVVSVKTGRNQFLVGYKLMSVTVLCSTNGLRFDTTPFQFFEHNCIFYGSSLFSCRIIALLTSAIEAKNSSENAQRWKNAYLNI